MVLLSFPFSGLAKKILNTAVLVYKESTISFLMNKSEVTVRLLLGILLNYQKPKKLVAPL